MKAPCKYAASAAFAAMTMAGSAAAWAHAALQSATPAKDAAVATAPAEITLRFNEKLEAAFSNAKLLDMDAMTMVFRVKDQAMLDQVKAGDKIRFVAEQLNGQLTVARLEI